MSEISVNTGEEAKQAEDLAKALTSTDKQSRERLARIVDLLPCYVLIIDENYRPVFYNKAFVDFFGEPGKLACHKVLRGQDAPCDYCPPFDASAGKGSNVMEWVSTKNKHAFRVYSYPFDEENGRRCVLKWALT